MPSQRRSAGPEPRPVLTGRLILATALAAAAALLPAAAQEVPPALPPPPAAAANGEGTGAAPATPATTDPVEADEPALPGRSGPTDAAPIIAGTILPAAHRFASATVALQNAVIRYCLGTSEAADLADVSEAFREAVVAAAATEPSAFGAEANRNAPELLATEVANTAFSRSRLDGIMNARIAAPRSLAELAAEAPALTGLPALERLLLSPPYTEMETKANRCRLAVTVAARIQANATVVEGLWRRRALDPQWTAEEPELADRLRLRDLVQAMIDVSDRLDRDAAEFATDPNDNDGLTYARQSHMFAYLDAVAGALLVHAGLVRRFAAPASPAADAIARIMAALAQGREALGGGNRAAWATASELFERTQQEVALLPAAFDFAPEAFQRPLASFQPVAAPPAPAASSE